MRGPCLCISLVWRKNSPQASLQAFVLGWFMLASQFKHGAVEDTSCSLAQKLLHHCNPMAMVLILQPHRVHIAHPIEDPLWRCVICTDLRVHKSNF